MKHSSQIGLSDGRQRLNGLSGFLLCHAAQNRGVCTNGSGLLVPVGCLNFTAFALPLFRVIDFIAVLVEIVDFLLLIPPPILSVVLSVALFSWNGRMVSIMWACDFLFYHHVWQYRRTSHYQQNFFTHSWTGYIANLDRATATELDRPYHLKPHKTPQVSLAGIYL